MALHWLWLLILGGVVAVGGVLASRLASGRQAAAPQLPGGSIALGVLLAGIAFLLCLPARFPFARGTEMGYGVLLGLAATLVALIALSLARPARQAEAAEVAAFAGVGGVAIIWLAGTALIFHGDPRYALIGGLAGALLCVIPLLWSRIRDDAAAGAMEFFGIAILILGLASLLAIHRYNDVAVRAYWSLPGVAFAGGLLGAVVAVLILGRTRAARWGTAGLTLVVGGGVWLGDQALLRHSQATALNPHLFYLLVMGWLVFGLAAALLSRAGDRLALRLASPLLGVALLVIAFNVAGAYGVSIALAAGLALALAFWPRDEGQRIGAGPLWLAALGVLFLGYRLFLANFGDDFRGDARLEFARHYVFVGLAIALLWAAAARDQRAGRGATVLQWAALVLLPAVTFVVFGYEVLLGLILGFWISQLLLPTLSIAAASAVPVVFFPLVTVWALIIPHWGHFMLDLPRWTRGLIVGVAFALAILALGLVRERRRASEE